MKFLWYWIFATLVALLCLGNTTLIVFRVIQVSNGRSMLDADAPASLKLRKWFLVLLGVANAIRFLFTIAEEVYVARSSIEPSTVWILRCIPSVLFLLAASFITHYLGNLNFSLHGSEGRNFRSIWLIVTLIFALTEFVCISILSAVSIEAYLHLLQFSFLVLAVHGFTILITIWYFALSIWRCLASNQINSLSTKTLVRMLILVACVTMSLLTMTLLRADEYEQFSANREMEVQTAGQWFLLLVGEGVSSLLMTLVITNALASWETHVRTSWVTARVATALGIAAPSSSSSSSSASSLAKQPAEQQRILTANPVHAAPQYQAISQQE